MIILTVIIIILLLIILKGYFLIQAANKETDYIQDNYSKLLSQKKSSEVRLGQISENLAPFLKDFKYNPKKTHFLGNPIDYIIFEEDKIVFLEIKSGKSTLSKDQRNIRDLIKNNTQESPTIIWDEMRIQ